MAIEKSKQNPMWRLVSGLGIKDVGESTAKILSKHYTLTQLCFSTKNDLLKIKGIGEKTASNIVSWFSDIENMNMMAQFKYYGVCPNSW